MNRRPRQTWLESLEPRCLLSTFVVDLATDEADTNYDPGDVSLREAVLLANAAGGADEIVFAEALAGSTLSLTAGEIAISDDVTIRGITESGDPASITISAGGASRVFNIGTATVWLEDLTLTDGDDGSALGGAIYTASTSVLAIDGCTFTGNTATNGAGIYNQGVLVVTNSVFDSNTATYGGGGINNALGASLSIANSTFSGNVAASGGAIKNNGGTLDIVGSTISGNTSAVDGGGIYNNGTATINSSTIALNTADSDDSGSGNGGALFAKSGAVTLTSTIIAGNIRRVSTDDDITLDLGTVTGTYNLIADAGSAGGLTDGVDNNIVGEDPLLAALADYGGTTQTHALQPGSPALDTGYTDGSVTTDQRGYDRTDDTTPDIGAFEQHSPVAGSLDAGASAIFRGDTLELTATGITDGDDNAASVAFYADTDGDGIADAGELLGTDTDGSDGWSLTVSDSQTSAFDTGSLDFLAVAADELGFTSDPASITVDIEYKAPTIGGLDADVSTIHRGDTLTLTATGVTAGDNAVAGVWFYQDADGDGIADAGELLGTDTDSASGYTLALSGTDTGSLPVGSNSFLAVVIDSSDVQSDPASAAVTVAYTEPSIGGVSADDTLIYRGDTITLTATGVSGGDNAIAQVAFYLDADGDGIADAGELLGTDTSSTGGYTLALSTSDTVGFALGANSILAVATDTDGHSTDPVSTTVTAEYRDPSITALQASDTEVRRGAALTLTATGVEAGDSMISGVSFFLDANGDGIADAGELLGTDTNGSDGYTVTLTGAQTALLETGQARFLAVVTDSADYTAGPAAATVTFISPVPTLTGIALGTGSIAQGQTLTITAQGVDELGGEPGGVRFYLDANGDGTPDAGELLGTDADSDGGYTLTLSAEQTAAFTAGSYTIIAVATDSFGASTDPVTAPLTVLYGQSASDDAPVRFTSDAAGEHRAIFRNAAGELVVFDDTANGWVSVPLTEITGAPDATGDPVMWTDPKDGLTYAAVPSAEGLLLFVRDDAGDWDFVNVSEGLVDPADIPVTALTQLTSKGNKVIVVGLNADGELVAFKQTGQRDGESWAWTFVNISDDLTAQGMETPAFTELIGYVTAWNSWTIAGVDPSGDIQGVWIAPGSFDRWRVDNLSAITGAPPIHGQLSVTLTDWSAINLGGVGADGRLVVTWWVPGFGGRWVTSDLTAAASGESLTPGVVTGFVSPWGAINYAGLNDDGEVVAYWWTPQTGGWRVSSLSSAIDSEAPRPVAGLVGHVAASGAMSVLGTSDLGHVVRLWWEPGESLWQFADITEAADRT